MTVSSFGAMSTSGGWQSDSVKRIRNSKLVFLDRECSVREENDSIPYLRRGDCVPGGVNVGVNVPTPPSGRLIG